ncbi:MAG: sporulation protein YqfD [Bacillota bacterium]|nr:sporulation protein YqfD [Bacillota bacterium]
MKNEWMENFYGKVTVRVAGKGIERFLNLLVRNGVHVQNVKRHGTETATFTLRVREALRIRPFARQSECSVEFLRRSGAPFVINRMLKNSGFIIGGLMFVFIVFFLSNSIWGIEIKGAKPATEYQIRKELDKMGVKIGRTQFSIANVEGIQRQLTNRIEALTWVGVELKGTTFHLQVVEKKQPKKTEQLSPRNLVAKKKATIVHMFVEKGKQMVNVYDHVVPGQLLVSGLIGKEGATKRVAAQGEILGETWYKSYVEMPLNTSFKVFNGKEEQKHYLRIGSTDIPLWGFGKLKLRQYETEENKRDIYLLKWKLPVSYVNKTFREKEEITRQYTKDEAIKKASEIALRDIKTRIDEDAKIKEEKILHRVFENGKVKLSIHFQIIENIAKGQPIPKETSE